MVGKRPKKRDRFTVGIERSANGCATKNFGETAPAEFEKARAMEAALANTPFRVPHAIHCDRSSGRVEFEYLENHVLLVELIEEAFANRRYRRVLKLNEAAGRLLGVLHQRLVLNEAREWEAPQSLLRRLPPMDADSSDATKVFLHCDYSPVNLMVSSRDELAVIDASPNSYFTRHPCLRGPRLVDVATYTTRLVWPYRLRTYHPRWRKMARVLRRRFLAAYEKTIGQSIDKRSLRAVESAAIHAFVRWKTENRLTRKVAISLEKLGAYLPADP